MNLKHFWGGSVGFKGVVLVALVSLIIGLGISGGLDWLSPSRAVNFMGDAGNSDSRLPNGLPDFVSLAKKMKPIVVNISTVTVSEGRGGGQEFSGPYGEEDPFNDFWRRFLVVRDRAGRSASAVSVRASSSIAMARLLPIIMSSKMPPRSSSNCPLTIKSMTPKLSVVIPRRISRLSKSTRKPVCRPPGPWAIPITRGRRMGGGHRQSLRPRQYSDFGDRQRQRTPYRSRAVR